MSLRAPFPWFGGKSRASEIVWSRLGDVDTYNEPFAGSLAVLLSRPHEARVETVNDLDCYLSNFWRALQADPDAVAYWADYPVNETDLHARHRWLVDRVEFQERMKADPDYFDAKIAGWWVWGQCLWIGSGWCQKPEWTGRGVGAAANRGVHSKQFERNGQGTVHQKRRPHLTADQGVVTHSKRPKLRGRGDDGIPTRRWQGGGAGGGSGVHAPRLTQQKPVLRGDSGAAGVGVHRSMLTHQKPDIGGSGSGSTGRGIHSPSFDIRSGGLYDYLGALSARLRRVRVCCGDWKRVLTPSVTTYVGMCGVLLDPPYSHDLRERCYSEDHDISADVRQWAIEHGDDPKFRIALCGYDGEHEMPGSWECVPWKAHGGYSRTERGKANRDRERIWFSPHCLSARDLFSIEASA